MRHGEIDNRQDVVYLRMDKEMPLTEFGKRQINDQAKKLISKNITAIYHSPLWRTTQTAEIVETQLQTRKVYAESGLLEVKCDPIQGLPRQEFYQLWGTSIYHPELIAQGCESEQQVASRMINTINLIAQKHLDQSIVIISHGDPIALVWNILDGIEPAKKNIGNDLGVQTAIVNYPQKGSITVIQYSDKLHKIDYWPVDTTPFISDF